MNNGHEPLRLNIGSGDVVTMKGYVNVDAKFGDIAYPLAYPDSSAEEIYASHILEHFSQHKTPDVLKDWVRALKPGGVLKIAVPDFNFIVSQHLAGNPNLLPLASYLMGGQQNENDFHKAIFDEGGLRQLLADAGLTNIQPWKSEVKDCAALPVSLNLMGRKPDAPPRAEIRLPFKTVEDALELAKNGHGKGVRIPTLEGADVLVQLPRLETQPEGNGVQVPALDSTVIQPDTPYKAFVASIRRFNQYSQFGEDSAIEAIFERIGTANKWCVECGAGDGLFFSNTRRLIEQGWKSVQIEADQKLSERLYERYSSNPNVVALHSRVGFEEGTRLDDVLDGCNMFSRNGMTLPTDFDLLTLDVDGQEYHILNSLTKFKPRVLIVEFNPNAPDPMYIPEPGAPTHDQAGLRAIGHAIIARGYEAICRTPVNLICVRRDLAHLLTQRIEEPSDRHFVAGEWRGSEQVSSEKVRIRAGVVMSTPRYGPLDAAEAISEIGAHLYAPRFKSGGAFWEQGLTRAIEQALDFRDGDGEPLDVFISVDYDTFATPDDAKKLIQLLYQNPQYDCIVPLQARRGVFSEILATTAGPVDMTNALVPIVTGHFGLTAFRRRVFENLRKPWLLSKSDPDGGWGDGRTDADIHFWQNFNDCGFKAAMAPGVVIGHGEEAVIFPRLVNGKIEKVYISVYEWLGERSVPENAGVIA